MGFGRRKSENGGGDGEEVFLIVKLIHLMFLLTGLIGFP